MKILIFLLIFIGLFVAFDTVECRIPPENLKKTAVYYMDEKSVIFRASGKTNCFFSTEGYRPRWSTQIMIKFQNKLNFYRDKTYLVSGIDFESQQIKSGTIFINRKNNNVVLSLIFPENNSEMNSINGSYDISELGSGLI